MSKHHRGVPTSDHADHELRQQEVRRANKELAAYFKGERTEREARAALKTIKAFIRYRERIDSASRRPPPATQSSPVMKGRGPKQTAPSKIVRRRPIHQTPRETSTGGDEAAAAQDVVLKKPTSAGATSD